MEELVFAYGARPSTGFTMLAQVTESTRAEQMDLSQLSQRFAALKGQTPSLALIQGLFVRSEGQFGRLPKNSVARPGKTSRSLCLWRYTGKFFRRFRDP